MRLLLLARARKLYRTARDRQRQHCRETWQAEAVRARARIVARWPLASALLPTFGGGKVG